MKFDELRQFHKVHFMKKPPTFVKCLEFFLKCIIGLRESNTEVTQN